MIFLCVLFVIGFVSTNYQSSFDDAGCGICVKPKLTKNDNKLYYFETHFKLDWFESYVYCRYKGMKLITIDSVTEENFIRDEIKRNVYDGDYWASATDLGHSGDYKWMSSGVSLHNLSQLWGTDYPDNAQPGEHCTYLNSKSDYTLAVTNCSQQLFIVCKTSTMDAIEVANYIALVIILFLLRTILLYHFNYRCIEHQTMKKKSMQWFHEYLR